MSREGGEVVALDLALTDELRRRGLVREVVPLRSRTCARPPASRSPTASCCTWSGLDVLADHFDAIAREVLAVAIVAGPGRGRGHRARARRRAPRGAGAPSGCARPTRRPEDRGRRRSGRGWRGSPGEQAARQRHLDAAGGGRVEHDQVVLGAHDARRRRRSAPARAARRSSTRSAEQVGARARRRRGPSCRPGRLVSDAAGRGRACSRRATRRPPVARRGASGSSKVTVVPTSAASRRAHARGSRTRAPDEGVVRDRAASGSVPGVGTVAPKRGSSASSNVLHWTNTPPVSRGSLKHISGRGRAAMRTPACLEVGHGRLEVAHLQGDRVHPATVAGSRTAPRRPSTDRLADLDGVVAQPRPCRRGARSPARRTRRTRAPTRPNRSRRRRTARS